MQHEEYVLRDGTRVVLRDIRRSDAEELRRAFLALSSESRYRRFFGALTDLDEAALRYLTEVDGMNHVAIIAVVESLDLKTEHAVGVVRFIRCADDPKAAELAVAVVDEMQNKGLGTHLTKVAMRVAQHCGVTHLRGDVLASNEPMVHALRDVGATSKACSNDVITFEVAVDEAETNVVRVLRRLLGIASRDKS